MLVFGGSDAEGPSDVLWRYDLTSHEWSRVATVGPPPEARELHASCVVSAPAPSTESFLIVSGGRGVSALLNSCYALRLPSANKNSGSSSAGRPAWEWNLVGQCPARCAHSLVALTVEATAPILPMLQPQPETATAAAGAAPAESSSSSTTAAAAAVVAPAAPASFSPPSPTSVALVLYGGTDGAMFYNDALLFWFDEGKLDPSLRAPALPCPKCQGPPGWTLMMQAPENREAEASEAAAAASAASPAACETKAKSKKKKKKTSGADVQPPTSFAHTLTPLPCASPAFAAPAASTNEAAASASASASASVPGSFLLFGGMNDEADLDETHVLAFVPLL